jgi:DNA-binding transcriptional activator of the SARP family
MSGTGQDKLADEIRGRMLRLKSLGQTVIEADDARLTPAAETVFATALYLIIETGRPVGRDELTQLLWPGVSEAQAQHGLRQALYRLKSLGATIKADRSALILSPRFCSTDFAALLAPQSPVALESLASKVGGCFLPGYVPQLSDEFASWVERQRDVVHSALARVLVAGMQAKKRVSDWNGAEQLAALCLTMDPLNEEATLTVAEAAALGGSKSRALSILNHYLEDIGENASEIKLPAVLLRRRISEAYQDNIFPVRDAPFVGREEEMTELTAALARAQTGHGSAYVIWGEPGIGKTRLVQEFTRVAALQRVHIVRVGCQSHDVRRPLSAFVDWCRSCWRFLEHWGVRRSRCSTCGD